MADLENLCKQLKDLTTKVNQIAQSQKQTDPKQQRRGRSRSRSRSRERKNIRYFDEDKVKPGDIVHVRTCPGTITGKHSDCQWNYIEIKFPKKPKTEGSN